MRQTQRLLGLLIMTGSLALAIGPAKAQAQYGSLPGSMVTPWDCLQNVLPYGSAPSCAPCPGDGSDCGPWCPPVGGVYGMPDCPNYPPYGDDCGPPAYPT